MTLHSFITPTPTTTHRKDIVFYFYRPILRFVKPIRTLYHGFLRLARAPSESKNVQMSDHSVIRKRSSLKSPRRGAPLRLSQTQSKHGVRTATTTRRSKRAKDDPRDAIVSTRPRARAVGRRRRRRARAIDWMRWMRGRALAGRGARPWGA